ncbi:hypothetical protein [Helicobacter cetorum]|uniref:hypothetical protein n=1 Tax=Helicobacter cetorum TaxID=138563 RepID=UPI000CF1454F|nr:hypothetical protein [Helicobacter cetorum]
MKNKKHNKGKLEDFKKSNQGEVMQEVKETLEVKAQEQDLLEQVLKETLESFKKVQKAMLEDKKEMLQVQAESLKELNKIKQESILELGTKDKEIIKAIEQAFETYKNELLDIKKGMQDDLDHIEKIHQDEKSNLEKRSDLVLQQERESLENFTEKWHKNQQDFSNTLNSIMQNATEQSQKDFGDSLEDMAQKLKKQAIDTSNQIEQSFESGAKRFVEQLDGAHKGIEEIFINAFETLGNVSKENLNDMQEKLLHINQFYNEIKANLESIYQDRNKLLDEREQRLLEKETEISNQQRVLEVEIREVETRKDFLEKEYEIKQEELDKKAQSEKDKYEPILEKLDDNNKFLREENESLKEQLNNPNHREISQLKQDLEKEQKEVVDYKRRLKNTEERLGESKLECEKLEEQQKEQRENFERVYNELNNKYLEQQDDLRQLDELRATKERLEFANETKELQIEEMRTQLESLKPNQGEKNQRILALQEDAKNAYKESSFEKLAKLESYKDYKDNEIDFLKNIQEKMEQQGIIYPKRLLYSFHSALKSASLCPLSVLAGVSGTGKSKLPELYAKFGGINFISEAVLPTWDSPQSMMGYFNMLENKFDATKLCHFLIHSNLDGYEDQMNLVLLDEMNLAHIELYFAEFLSKFEQRRNNSVNLDIKIGTGMNYELSLSPNTLYIGTMNEDETTKTLSDKVIDRGYILYFPRPKSLHSLKNNLVESSKTYLSYQTWKSWQRNDLEFLELLQDEAKSLIEHCLEITNEINKALSKTNRAIGHRVWQAMQSYIYNYPTLVNASNDGEEALKKAIHVAFEDSLALKIMPKLSGLQTHGDEGEVLNKISEILHNESYLKNLTKDFEQARKNSYEQFLWVNSSYLNDEDDDNKE